MKNSIGYLYDKIGPDTDLHPRFSTELTKDSFFEFVDTRCQERQIVTGKENKNNTQYQHLVLSFHPEDRNKFDGLTTNIIEEVCKQLKIEPENHGLTAFVHNDRLHPHIHLAFSKIGADGSLYKDSNSFRNYQRICALIDEKYGFISKSDNQNITLTRKDLYNPTKRGELLKTIDFARKEAKSLSEFQQILARHGVQTNKTKENKFVYILKDRQTYQDHLLPKEARLTNLYSFIKSEKHDVSELNRRKEITDVLVNTESLLKIQEIFPHAKIQYEAAGQKLFNVKVEIENEIFNLSNNYDIEVDYNLEKESTDYSKYMSFPLIFTNKLYDDYHDEQKESPIIPKTNKRKILGQRNKI